MSEATQIMDTDQRRSEALRAALRKALAKSSLSREQIADDLSKLVGRPISVHMLAKWVAEKADKWQLPADCVPALCSILGDDEIQMLILSDQLRGHAELGARVVQQWHLAREIADRAAALAEPRPRGKRAK